MTTLKVIRFAVIAISVVGIAGMIIGSLADNNNGVVITFGLLTAMSIVVLIAVTAVARGQAGSPATGGVSGAGGAVDERLAEQVEQRVQALLASGLDEGELRALVGDAVRLGRSAHAPAAGPVGDGAPAAEAVPGTGATADTGPAAG